MRAWVCKLGRPKSNSLQVRTDRFHEEAERGDVDVGGRHGARGQPPQHVPRTSVDPVADHHRAELHPSFPRLTQYTLDQRRTANTVPVFTYHSRFISEGVAEASQIFHRDAHVLPKLLSFEEYCRRDR
jgi:hypothetical protein